MLYGFRPSQGSLRRPTHKAHYPLLLPFKFRPWPVGPNMTSKRLYNVERVGPKGNTMRSGFDVVIVIDKRVGGMGGFHSGFCRCAVITPPPPTDDDDLRTLP